MNQALHPTSWAHFVGLEALVNLCQTSLQPPACLGADSMAQWLDHDLENEFLVQFLTNPVYITSLPHHL